MNAGDKADCAMSAERRVYIEMRKMGFNDCHKGTTAVRDITSALIKSEPTVDNYKVIVEELSKMYGTATITITHNMRNAIEYAFIYGSFDYVIERLGNVDEFNNKLGVRFFVLRLATVMKHESEFETANLYNFRKLVMEDVKNAKYSTLEVVHGIMQYLMLKDESEVMA